MRKRETLKYVFHNPNTPEETERFLAKWLVDINMPKVERIISEYALNNAEISEEGEDFNIISKVVHNRSVLS